MMEKYTERGQDIQKELVWKESRTTMCDLLSDMSETSNDFTTLWDWHMVLNLI